MRYLLTIFVLLSLPNSFFAQDTSSGVLFGDTANLADREANTGVEFYKKQSFDSSIAHFEKAILLFQQQDELEKSAYAKRFAGICYNYKGLNNQALPYFQEALEYFMQTGEEEFLVEKANLYGNMGMAYRSLSRYEVAVENLILAIRLFEKLKDEKNIANTYNHLGNIYRDWSNLGKAEEYYQQAFQLSEKLANEALQASTLNNLAIIYREKKEFEKAIECYQKSILIKEKLGNKRGVAASCLGLGITYKTMENYPLALEYYQKTLELNLQVGDKSGEGAALSNIGLLYIKLQKPELALSYLLQSDEIAQDINYQELHKNNTLGISEAYELMKNYAKALEYAQLHYQIQDSIFSIEKLKEMKEIEEKYESEKKEQQIELLAVENELKEAKNKAQDRTLRILFVTLSLLILSVILILTQYIHKNRAYKLLVKRSLELSRAKSPDRAVRENSTISDEKIQELIQNLEEYFKKEKAYLRPDFQLQDCAKDINSNSKYVSLAINEVYKASFTCLVNELRILEASTLFASSDSKNMTIEAIAQQVGFNSKSAFNTAFKRYMGVTPSYYIKNLNQVTFND